MWLVAHDCDLCLALDLNHPLLYHSAREALSRYEHLTSIHDVVQDTWWLSFGVSSRVLACQKPSPGLPFVKAGLKRDWLSHYISSCTPPASHDGSSCRLSTLPLYDIHTNDTVVTNLLQEPLSAHLKNGPFGPSLHSLFQIPLHRGLQCQIGQYQRRRLSMGVYYNFTKQECPHPAVLQLQLKAIRKGRRD